MSDDVLPGFSVVSAQLSVFPPDEEVERSAAPPKDSFPDGLDSDSVLFRGCVMSERPMGMPGGCSARAWSGTVGLRRGSGGLVRKSVLPHPLLVGQGVCGESPGPVGQGDSQSAGSSQTGIPWGPLFPPHGWGTPVGVAGLVVGALEPGAATLRCQAEEMRAGLWADGSGRSTACPPRGAGALFPWGSGGPETKSPIVYREIYLSIIRSEKNELGWRSGTFRFCVFSEQLSD